MTTQKSKSSPVKIKLRKLNKKKVKYVYKLKNPFRLRKLAIDEGILKGAKNYKDIRKAALYKKARFNVLRIYRKYSDKKGCKILTRDMKYIDRTYLGPKSTTRNIC
mgnify:CR=1 FL=1